MSAYIEELRRQTGGNSAQSHKQQTLEGRFLAWYGNLLPEAQHRPFAMREIETALNSQGRHISAVLVQLGWQRKRVWSAQRYCRYWLPPCAMQ
jgi:hypothetical protein